MNEPPRTLVNTNHAYLSTYKNNNTTVTYKYLNANTFVGGWNSISFFGKLKKKIIGTPMYFK